MVIDCVRNHASLAADDYVWVTIHNCLVHKIPGEARGAVILQGIGAGDCQCGMVFF